MSICHCRESTAARRGYRPLFDRSLGGVPDTLIVTAECDPLRDDGERHADHLRRAGVTVELRRYEGMIHGFFQLTGVLEGSRRLHRDLGDWIRGAAGGEPTEWNRPTEGVSSLTGASFHTCPRRPDCARPLRGHVCLDGNPRVGRSDRDSSVCSGAGRQSRFTSAPRPVWLWAIALGGSAAAARCACSPDERSGTRRARRAARHRLPRQLDHGVVRLGGLLAWSRRPSSRFGPLMITAGSSTRWSRSWTTNDVTFSLGQALDLVPPVLFLHVFLAFPTGRLKTRFERVLVIVAYVSAITLQLVRMAFGGFGANNLLEVTAGRGSAHGGACPAAGSERVLPGGGPGILIARRLRTGRPLRRSRALLVDAFALGLVMIAALFLSHVLNGPALQQLRWWATFAALGLAPIAS